MPVRVSILDHYSYGNNVTLGPDSETTTDPGGLLPAQQIKGNSDWSWLGGANWDGSFNTDFRQLPGGMVYGRIGAKRSNGAVWAGGDGILLLGGSLRPGDLDGASFNQITLNGYQSNGLGWNAGSVACSVDINGSIIINGMVNPVHGVFGSFMFPAAGA